MASWQAKVLNSVVSMASKAGLHGAKTVSLSDIRLRLLALDSHLTWPAALSVAEIGLSESNLLHYQIVENPSDNAASKNDSQGGTLALFYIRGGGFCFKSPHIHGRFIEFLCRQLGAEAFVPDYRLAPEHPFPAPFNDVLEAFEAFLSRWHGPFVIMGDSAGGNLAMSLIMEAKVRGLPLGQALVLLSPVLDLALTGDSESFVDVDDPFFTVDSLLRLRGAYLQGANPMDSKVSPLHGNVKGLPPVLLIAGTRELLLDDAKRMALKLSSDNVALETHFIANMPHVFPLFEFLPEAQNARELIVKFIRQNSP